MNIKGIGSASGINYYNQISCNKIEKAERKVIGDRIELSETAKALKDYSIDKEAYDNSAKVQEIQNKLSNGTYKCDAKLTAKGIIDHMKGQY